MIQQIIKYISYYWIIVAFLLLTSCQQKSDTKFTNAKGEVKLIVVAPGHFHADLLLKSNSDRINDTVFVYAPTGNELNQHLSRIESYNNRVENPTSWKEIIYSGNDFMNRMLTEKPGNVVLLAGNNQMKTDFILKSVEAGLNVLSDKPMAINSKNFKRLEQAFQQAKKKQVLLYDIMTERYDILNEIEKILIRDKELFGEIQKGTPDEPAVSLESTHHFYKNVSGKPLVRPAWYYDVEQQGEGIVDIATHLVDLVNWQCFPEMVLDYTKDVELVSANHWTTDLTLQQFSQSTQVNEFPEYLNKYISGDLLKVYANGEIHYKIKDVNIALKVIWNYEAPEGSGDTYSSIIKGTKAVCKIIQNKEQNYISQLYIQKIKEVNQAVFETNLKNAIKQLQETYPFITLIPENEMYKIEIPVENRESHEAHFSLVGEKYFDFLVNRDMPVWEVPNMLTKYFITTKALELAQLSN